MSDPSFFPALFRRLHIALSHFSRRACFGQTFFGRLTLFFGLLLPVSLRAQAWVDAQRQGTEVRFLFGNTVRRFELTTQTWMPAITLPRSGATAFAWDTSNCFVAYGTALYKYSAALTGEVSVGTVETSIHGLFLDGNLLIASRSLGANARFSIFDRNTRAVLRTQDSSGNSLFGASHAPGLNRLYGRNQGSSVKTIVICRYTNAGDTDGIQPQAHNENYPDATRTWVFPGEGKVVDSAGSVYDTGSLEYITSLKGSVTDIAFAGDAPVVLQGNMLVAFRSNLIEASRRTLAFTTGVEVQVDATNAYVFRTGSPDPLVETVPLAALGTPAPGEPVDGSLLAYTPASIFQDRDGLIGLFSQTDHAVLRWSPAQRTYTAPLALQGNPTIVSYSPASHRLYTAEGATVRQMNAVPGAATTPFTTLSTAVKAMATAGEFPVISSQDSTRSFSPAGTGLAGSNDSYARYYEWDPVKRRMYQDDARFSDSKILYNVVALDGRLTDYTNEPFGLQYPAGEPIRINEDGTRLVMGNGKTVETAGLTLTTPLPIEPADALWNGSTLVTIRLLNQQTLLQTWSVPQFTAGPLVRQFAGTPLRLLKTASGFLVITKENRAPRFHLLNESFDLVFDSPLPSTPPSALGLTGRTDTTMSLQWVDQSSDEDGFRVDYRLSNGGWIAGATAAANATSATVSGLTPGTRYDFRVTATHAGLDSAFPPAVTASTLADSNQPSGEPYDLRVAQIFHDRITLQWMDNATNETGFRILRSTTPEGTVTTLNAPAGATSFTDNGLAANTTFYYRIQVYNGALSGELSAQVSGRTLTGAAVPAAPGTLRVTENAIDHVSLAWLDNSTDEDEFIVERSTPSAPAWVELARPVFNSTAYTDAAVAPATTYNYRVSAKNARGSSAASNPVPVTTPTLGGTFANMAMRSGSVYYFAFTSPSRIERYDLTGRAWLSPVALQAVPTALWVDEAGIYAAEGNAVFRFALDGTGRAYLGTSASTLYSIVTTGDWLVMVSQVYTVVNKNTGIGSYQTNFGSPGKGFSVTPGQNRAFYRTVNRSPGIMGYLEVSPEGTAVTSVDSPDADDFPGATRTFVFPNGQQVADDSGNIYGADSLQHTNSMGAALTDLAFYGADIPIVLRANRLFSYNNVFGEAGSFTLSASGVRLAVETASAEVVVFIPDTGNSHGLRIQTVPLASVNAPVPGQPIDPNGLAYTPESMFLDRDGNLLLHAPSQQNVFRWSPVAKAYLTGLPLSGTAKFSAYSRDTHTMYLAYGSKRVGSLNFTAAAPVEQPFITLSNPPAGIATAGSYLYAALSTINGADRRTFSPSGQEISSIFFGYNGNWNEWDPVKRRMYHFRDSGITGSLYFDTLDASGRLTGGGDVASNLLGTSDTVVPIRVSPDGKFVLLGSGKILETAGLTVAGNLFTIVKDMSWFGGKLVSLEPQGSTGTRLRQWTTTWLREKTRAFNGTPLRVIPLSSTELLVVTFFAGRPRFVILDQDLVPQFDSVDEPPAIVTQPLSVRVDFRASATLFVEAAGTPPLTYQWLKGGVPVPDSNTAALVLTNLGSADAGEYKVTVSNEGGTVTSDGAFLSVGSMNAPLFTPGNLLVSSGGKISEYTATGIKRSEIAVPVPLAGTPVSHTVLDVVTDPLGGVHVLNEGRPPEGGSQFYVSSFDSERQTWAHRLMPGYTRSLNTSDGDLTLSGSWVYTATGRVNLATSAEEPLILPASVTLREISAGLDGLLYTCDRFGKVNRLNQALSVAGSWQFASSPDLRAITADSSGKMFVADATSRIGAWSATGTLIKWFTPSGTYSGFYDISLSAGGRIAAGSSNGSVAVTDTSLNTVVSINPGTSSSSYTTWIVPVSTPTPSLIATPSPPGATEDILYTWTPQIDYPDPDAVLTLTASVLPPWLSLSGNSLTGTPLQAHVGPHVIRLRATDALGHFAERDFVISVSEVNDRPVAVNHTVSVDEDTAPVEMDIAGLFTDEETPAADLEWQIAGTVGTTVVPSLTGSVLRLTFPADANGEATVTIRATDAGGLSADSIITVSVRPVPDPPSFPALIPPATLGVGAESWRVDFNSIFTDPDAGDRLTFTIGEKTNPLLFSRVTVGTDGVLDADVAPYRWGNSRLRVKATGTDGLSAETWIDVVVPEPPAPSFITDTTSRLNRQTGLLELTVTVKNTGLRALGGFEIFVSGLPPGVEVYNASRQSEGAWIVHSETVLSPGAESAVILEFYSPTRSASALDPVIITRPIMPDGARPADGTGFAIDRIVRINGGMLLELPTEAGASYEMQWSDDGVTWKASLSPIHAAGTRVQWIDRGQPRTDKSPLEVPSRLYRAKKL